MMLSFCMSELPWDKQVSRQSNLAMDFISCDGVYRVFHGSSSLNWPIFPGNRRKEFREYLGTFNYARFTEE
jgi:hypothetical protein